MSDTEFAGKSVLVSGAGSGIGRATALRFAALGASVAVVDIDSRKGDETVELITKVGGVGLYIEADLSVEQGAADMVRRTVDEFGGLHCAFNNVGFGERRMPLHETPIEEWN